MRRHLFETREFDSISQVLTPRVFPWNQLADVHKWEIIMSDAEQICRRLKGLGDIVTKAKLSGSGTTPHACYALKNHYKNLYKHKKYYPAA